MNKQHVPVRNPWSFLPTLYFAEGLPYVLINTVSVILYKRMGIDNAHIAFWTSWLYLPWVIKMFWGPLGGPLLHQAELDPLDPGCHGALALYRCLRPEHRGVLLPFPGRVRRRRVHLRDL